MKRMEGMTISEMAEILGLPRDTVKHRIRRGGFEPLTKDAVYAKEVFDAIRNVPGKGRPPKAKPEAPAAPEKPAKKTKK
jgi:predicted ArsR family transcriptional regulator